MKGMEGLGLELVYATAKTRTKPFYASRVKVLAGP